MSGSDAATLRIDLDGDWSIGEVAERFSLLTQHLIRLPEVGSAAGLQANQAGALLELNLTGITDLDACGCQLLAQFILSVRQRGVGTRINGIPEAFIPKIHLLGFDQAFNLSVTGNRHDVF